MCLTEKEIIEFANNPAIPLSKAILLSSNSLVHKKKKNIKESNTKDVQNGKANNRITN